jgi:hypothetical protein
MAVLDRILVNVDWESKFPLAKVKVMPKEGSDHISLMVDFGEDKIIKEHAFRFEKWWMEMEGFEELVNKAWSIECPHSDPVDIWQFKIRVLRKKMKGWSRNMEVARNKRKKEILIEIDFLDSLIEQAPLSAQQKLKRQKLKGELEEMWRVEEIRARQRSRDRDVKEGDKNTTYFFALANQRKRKNVSLAW